MGDRFIEVDPLGQRHIQVDLLRVAGGGRRSSWLAEVAPLAVHSERGPQEIRQHLRRELLGADVANRLSLPEGRQHGLAAGFDGYVAGALAAGRFRRDLLDRLDVAVIEVPPLRARLEDVADLAPLFTRRCAVEYARPGVTLAAEAVPFPIPKAGLECLWNHLLRYRNDTILRTYASVAPTPGGQYTVIQIREQILIPYSVQGSTVATINNKVLLFLQEVIAPARLAGQILLVHETLDQIKEPRQAWT